MEGNGTGKLHGKQLFVCRKHFALFCPIEGVMPEKDFLDENPKNVTDRITSEKVKRQEQIHKDEMLARSMSYSGDTTGTVQCMCLLVCVSGPMRLFHKGFTPTCEKHAQRVYCKYCKWEYLRSYDCDFPRCLPQ